MKKNYVFFYFSVNYYTQKICHILANLSSFNIVRVVAN